MKHTSHAPLWVVASLVGLLLSGCGGTAALKAPSANPQFDWFEYQGRDPIYEANPAGPNQYHNPILAGYYPDPSITRVGDDFYLVNSSFAHFPGVPIFHSRDLVNWTQLGFVLDRPSQLDLDSLGISRGIFAPTIEYHDGVFYMITTLIDNGGNFFVTATDPAGPWSDPVWLNFDGIDPAFFFDDDGKAYVINNGPPEGTPLYDGHRAIWIQEFDIAAKQLVGPRRLIVNGGIDLSQKPVWIEGPHIYKVNGRYYLSCAEGGTSVNHSQVILGSDSVWGPYVPGPNNPTLTQRHLDPDRPNPVTSTGHADLVQLPNGDWWAVFLAVRPYEGNFYNTGRETFLLPVTWKDGWPIILEGDAEVPYVHERPNLPRQPKGPLPLSGNFTMREDFNGDALPDYWQLIRTPRESWYSVEDGALTLRARSVPLGTRGQPTFVGRRQQHTHATATTSMTYRPTTEGAMAGLTAFQDDSFFYALVVTQAQGQPTSQLLKKATRLRPGQPRTVTPPEVVASAPLELPASGTISLRVEADGPTYRFSYATTPNAWQNLGGDVDGKVLSTEVAGGFVGTLFGLYAYTP